VSAVAHLVVQAVAFTLAAVVISWAARRMGRLAPIVLVVAGVVASSLAGAMPSLEIPSIELHPELEEAMHARD
jgi:ABC-type Fe3+-siderophore transport system permease subunit